MKLEDMRLISCDQDGDPAVMSIVTPELIAEIFAEMDSTEQAKFFNHVAEVASQWNGMGFPMQLQYITDEDGLTLAGRRVMQGIGDYSHWGLVDRLPY